MRGEGRWVCWIVHCTTIKSNDVGSALRCQRIWWCIKSGSFWFNFPSGRLADRQPRVEGKIAILHHIEHFWERFVNVTRWKEWDSDCHWNFPLVRDMKWETERTTVTAFLLSYGSLWTNSGGLCNAMRRSRTRGMQRRPIALTTMHFGGFGQKGTKE